MTILYLRVRQGAAWQILLKSLFVGQLAVSALAILELQCLPISLCHVYPLLCSSLIPVLPTPITWPKNPEKLYS